MKADLIKREVVHQGKVTSLTPLSDGGFVSASSGDSTYKFWGSDGKFKGWFKLDGCLIETIMFTSSGKLIAGTSNGCIGVYGKNSQLLRGVSGVHDPVEKGSDFAPVKYILEIDKEVLASSSCEGIINVMKTDGECMGKYLVKMTKDSDPIIKMILLSDGTICVGLQNSATILIFDKQFQLLNSFKVSKNQLDDVIELSDGKLCTACGAFQEKGMIKVWTTKGELESEFSEDCSILAEVNGLIVAHDKGKSIEINIFKRDGSLVYSLEEETLEESEVIKMITLKDGNLVVSLESGEIIVWELSE